MISPEPLPRLLPTREPLPDTRASITHHVVIHSQLEDTDLYITCGLYHDGRIGELFIKASRAGSRVHGFMDNLAIILSIALQYGVPLEPLAEKLRATRFEPAGWVSGFPPGLLAGQEGKHLQTTSPLDYLARWLLWRFPGGILREQQEEEQEKDRRK